MSKFSVDMDKNRIHRCVFNAQLWNNKKGIYSENINVMLDTGSFTTSIYKPFVSQYGTMLNEKMSVALGGQQIEANLCVLHKLNIGGHVMEKVVALAIPFGGELREHILLGTNVTNNWKFTVSRQENNLSAVEQGSFYRYCYNMQGQVLSFQE